MLACQRPYRGRQDDRSLVPGGKCGSLVSSWLPGPSVHASLMLTKPASQDWKPAFEPGSHALGCALGSAARLPGREAPVAARAGWRSAAWRWQAAGATHPSAGGRRAGTRASAAAAAPVARNLPRDRCGNPSRNRSGDCAAPAAPQAKRAGTGAGGAQAGQPAGLESGHEEGAVARVGFEFACRQQTRAAGSRVIGEQRCGGLGIGRVGRPRHSVRCAPRPRLRRLAAAVRRAR